MLGDGRKKRTFVAVRKGQQQPVQLDLRAIALLWPVPSKNGRNLFVVGSTLGAARGGAFATTQSPQIRPFLSGIQRKRRSRTDGQWVAMPASRKGHALEKQSDGSQRTKHHYPPPRRRAPELSPRWPASSFSMVSFARPNSRSCYRSQPKGGTPPQKFCLKDPQEPIRSTCVRLTEQKSFARTPDDPTTTIGYLRSTGLIRFRRFAWRKGPLFEPRSPDGTLISPPMPFASRQP